MNNSRLIFAFNAITMLIFFLILSYSAGSVDASRPLTTRNYRSWSRDFSAMIERAYSGPSRPGKGH
ncbi:hypothetical protein FRX31_022036 [Thalictrum thalictroides]|uniref:Transmembrane protein n=1 Tax=Thalictrum thalictroides TaxID=46969 RepID=A0A7J6VW14_THATH|nr:hypothetical protein FRX31_022036 [Thalictrum thalictroides]